MWRVTGRGFNKFQWNPLSPVGESVDKDNVILIIISNLRLMIRVWYDLKEEGNSFENHRNWCSWKMRFVAIQISNGFAVLVCIPENDSKDLCIQLENVTLSAGNTV